MEECCSEFEKENNTIKESWEEAVKTGADLRGADFDIITKITPIYNFKAK